jgi:hypothetical protein
MGNKYAMLMGNNVYGRNVPMARRKPVLVPVPLLVTGIVPPKHLEFTGVEERWN